MVARATAPNRLGPSTVFPDAGSWDFSQGLKGICNLGPISTCVHLTYSRKPNGPSIILDCLVLPAYNSYRVLLVLS